MKSLAFAFVCAFSTIFFPNLATAGSAQLLLDARTGQVLAAENPDELNHPASLTKMMTIYMTFDAIRRGKISWDSKVPFSRHAAARPPTKLWVKAGDSITVREAVLGMIVVSANDAAAAIAEKLGGSEERFAALMTEKARSLGMRSTVFRNASGLPDSRQVTTARDMSTLGVVLLRDFPEEYRLFAAESFTFRGKKIRGHNNLMYRYGGMDGIKTGYTNASGFNLVSAVAKGNRRVIGVVMGGRTAAGRDKIMEGLIDANIGKASNGSQLVASTGRSAAAVLARLGDDVPVPTARHDPITALIEAGQGAVPLPSSRYEAAYAEGSSASEAFEAVAPRPPAAVIVKQKPMAVAAAVAGARPAAGWQIQIAAAGSAEAAMQLLAGARAKVGDVLAGRDVYTEPVQAGDTTLYRARFTGFSTKSEAEAACDSLVRNRYDCLLMPARG